VRLNTPPNWLSDLLRSLDVVLAVDDSGSESVIDPTGVRYAAALSVLNFLRRRDDAMVGVVHWGSAAPAELMLPLTPTSKYRRIEKALTIPEHGLGGTNVAAGLAAAADLLAHGRDDAQPVVAILSDGLEQVGSAAAHEISRLRERCVHVILVDPANTCSPDLEAGWRALGLGSFTRLDEVRTEPMAWQIAEIVARAAGTAMPPLPNPNN
jgi:Mg-chelatase subunit ChlD